jgi:hypothetical protein
MVLVKVNHNKIFKITQGATVMNDIVFTWNIHVLLA